MIQKHDHFDSHGPGISALKKTTLMAHHHYHNTAASRGH